MFVDNIYDDVPIYLDSEIVSYDDLSKYDLELNNPNFLNDREVIYNVNTPKREYIPPNNHPYGFSGDFNAGTDRFVDYARDMNRKSIDDIARLAFDQENDLFKNN